MTSHAVTTCTLHVALPFNRTEDGHLVPGEAKQFDCAAAAAREAEEMRAVCAGAVAFSRVVDPSLGRCAGVSLLSRHGDVPKLEYLLAA